MPDTTEPAAPATIEEALEPCWQDARDRKFTVEIIHMLEAAEDEIHADGAALEVVTRALAAVDGIRAKLIAELAFRRGSELADEGSSVETIETRINQQRSKLFESQAIIECVRAGMTRIEDSPYANLALGSAFKGLDSVVNELELIAMDAREVRQND